MGTSRAIKTSIRNAISENKYVNFKGWNEGIQVSRNMSKKSSVDKPIFSLWHGGVEIVTSKPMDYPPFVKKYLSFRVNEECPHQFIVLKTELPWEARENANTPPWQAVDGSQMYTSSSANGDGESVFSMGIMKWWKELHKYDLFKGIKATKTRWMDGTWKYYSKIQNVSLENGTVNSFISADLEICQKGSFEYCHFHNQIFLVEGIKIHRNGSEGVLTNNGRVIREGYFRCMKKKGHNIMEGKEKDFEKGIIRSGKWKYDSFAGKSYLSDGIFEHFGGTKYEGKFIFHKKLENEILWKGIREMKIYFFYGALDFLKNLAMVQSTAYKVPKEQIDALSHVLDK